VKEPGGYPNRYFRSFEDEASRWGEPYMPKVWIEDIARWLVKKYNKGQSTFCYCPKCGLELCNSRSWYAEESQLQRFLCIKCGHKSGWLFDVPCPILIEGKVNK
jgi:hypothetical protein